MGIFNFNKSCLMSYSVIWYHCKSFYRKGQLVMGLPWHKLNHKKQNFYILLGAVVLAGIVIGGFFLINMY